MNFEKEYIMKKIGIIFILSISLTALILASCAKTQAPLSSEKGMMTFSFSSPAVTGEINDSSKIIDIMVPRGTDVKSLAATFTFTGSKVEVGSIAQTSAATANDFSSPVVYKVIAADNSTVNYTVMVAVQRSCLFLSAAPDPGAPADTTLIAKLRSWKYIVTVAASSMLPTMTADTFALYDFAFLSETPNSSEYYPLKGHPLPLLNLEAWGADKPNVLEWTSPYAPSVANWDTVPCIMVDSTNGQLSAGFPVGKEFKLVSGTSVSGEAEIAFRPTIEVIPIAALKDSSSLLVACGVEKGTLLADSTTITQNRAVTIGIHASAYQYITDEAYQLIRAGIHWILKE
jgi:uncharacterized protein YcfL